VAARRDAALEEIGEQAEKAARLRAGVAATVPDDLLELYRKLRTQHGVGAAALRAGRCEGCHLSLNTVDLARIRAAAPAGVVGCEECRRILVRPPESGLCPAGWWWRPTAALAGTPDRPGTAPSCATPRRGRCSPRSATASAGPPTTWPSIRG